MADENFEEAEKVIQEIAKVNKKEIPHNLLTKLREEVNRSSPILFFFRGAEREGQSGRGSAQTLMD